MCTFERVASHSLELRVVYASKSSSSSSSSSSASSVSSLVGRARVLCRYVRREVRALSARERGALLDAMRVLWDVGTAEVCRASELTGCRVKIGSLTHSQVIVSLAGDVHTRADRVSRQDRVSRRLRTK